MFVRVAAAATVAALLAGCGGAGSTGPGAAPTATPAAAASEKPAVKPGPVAAPPVVATPGESAAHAAQRALDAGTRKVRKAGTGRLTWTAELANVTGRLTQSARNSYDLRTDRWAAQVTVSAAAGELAFDYAASGAKLFVTFRQGMPAQLKDRWLGLDRASVPELETGRSVLAALGAITARSSRASGKGTVVRGTLPAARALDLLALSGVPELAGRRVAGMATVDVRLDSAGRVAGLTLRGADIALTGAVPESVRRSVAGSLLTVRLAGFGEKVTVAAPKTWVPIDAAELPVL